MLALINPVCLPALRIAGMIFLIINLLGRTFFVIAADSLIKILKTYH